MPVPPRILWSRAEKKVYSAENRMEGQPYVTQLLLVRGGVDS